MRYTVWSEKTMEKDKKILIYDNECEVCTLAKNSVEKRDKGGQFRLVGSHSEEGKRLQEQYKIDANKSAYVIESGSVREKSDMAFHVLENLGWFERFVARTGRLVPKRAADSIYSFIAKHRNVLKKH